MPSPQFLVDQILLFFFAKKNKPQNCEVVGPTLDKNQKKIVVGHTPVWLKNWYFCEIGKIYFYFFNYKYFSRWVDPG